MSNNTGGDRIHKRAAFFSGIANNLIEDFQELVEDTYFEPYSPILISQSHHLTQFLYSHNLGICVLFAIALAMRRRPFLKSEIRLR